MAETLVDGLFYALAGLGALSIASAVACFLYLRHANLAVSPWSALRRAIQQRSAPSENQADETLQAIARQSALARQLMEQTTSKHMRAIAAIIGEHRGEVDQE